MSCYLVNESGTCMQRWSLSVSQYLLFFVHVISLLLCSHPPSSQAHPALWKAFGGERWEAVHSSAQDTQGHDYRLRIWREGEPIVYLQSSAFNIHFLFRLIFSPFIFFFSSIPSFWILKTCFCLYSIFLLFLLWGISHI